MTTKHGIAIRDRKTGKLVHFIETPYGNSALRTLSGVRMQMDSKRFKANEEILHDEEEKKKDSVEEKNKKMRDRYL